MTRAHGPAAGLAVSVHGPGGVLDLVVPAGAAVADVAREYAAQSSLPGPPPLRTRLGVPLPAEASLAEAGIDTGAVLVAVPDTGPRPAAPTGEQPPPPVRDGEPGPVTTLWFCVAAATAALAGWFAAHTSAGHGTAAVDLLLLAAAIGVVPVGRYAAHRALAAPAFAAAAAFAVAWDPDPSRVPMALGIAALAGAVGAAVARAVEPRVEEALRVWIAAGLTVFAVAGLAALLGLEPRVVWAVLLVGCLLAARFVPALAVDVPDQLLIDLERLAVTAWSARDRPGGRRGRTVVPVAAVAAVAAHGSRIVTAAGAAVLVVVSVSAPLLLATATLELDRIGARCLVFFAGAGLLLAARSYRHGGARALLRAAGLAAWGVLAVVLLTGLDAGAGAVAAGAAILLALLLVVVAVATGRGWRSAWWARRAEVAEALCGSAAVASVFVATGLFRSLWELTS